MSRSMNQHLFMQVKINLSIPEEFLLKSRTKLPVAFYCAFNFISFLFQLFPKSK